MRKDENYEKYGKNDSSAKKAAKKKKGVVEASPLTPEEEMQRMSKNLNRNIFRAVTAGVLISLGFAAVIFIVFVKMDFITINKFNADGTRRDVSESSLSSKLSEINKYLEDYYYDVPDLTKAEDNMIKEYIAAYGDEYTIYYTKDEFDALKSAYAGNETGGLGIFFEKDDETGGMKVLSFAKDSVAEGAGLKQGDIIVKVNGEDIRSLSAMEMKQKAVGDIGTSVDVEYLRDGQTNNVSMERGAIYDQSVFWEMINDNDKAGYIRISEFTNITPEQFEYAVSDLEQKGAKSLVLDIRNNPGGGVDSVAEVLARILKEEDFGYLKDKKGNVANIRASSEDEGENKSVDIPMIVLVNEDTASSAEIMAATLQDYGKAKLLGNKTYGKGVAQNLVGLSDGSGLRFTEDGIFSPKGRSWNKTGLTPDIEVDMSTSSDDQLNAGLKELGTSIGK